MGRSTVLRDLVKNCGENLVGEIREDKNRRGGEAYSVLSLAAIFCLDAFAVVRGWF